MLSNHFVKVFVLSAFIFTLSSCLVPAPDPSVGSGVDISTVNTVDGAMYFKIETARYDQPAVKTTKLTCQIFAGDPTTKTCTLAIPEEELFYSKFFMTFGSGNASACKVINFYPFAYLASYSATFTPPWLFNPAVVDCSRPIVGDKLPAGCYNGAAKEILSSFPDKTFVHFFPENGVEGKTSMSSPYEAGMRYDNSWIANNLTDRATEIVGRYKGTTAGIPSDLIYQDWGVECMDEYYEPVYSITVSISDQDITTGENPGDPVLDDFYDWVGL